MSSAVSGPRLSSHPGQHERDREQADRDVEPEDPLPARPSTTAPPTSGPLATAMPVIALKIPIAAPRCSGGNAALSSARPSGISSAAPAPCTARAAISQPTSGASAQAADADGEQAEPGGVEPAPPVAVAERRAGDQQHGEAQVVGVDGPLELLDRGAEVDAGSCSARSPRRACRAPPSATRCPSGRSPSRCLCLIPVEIRHELRIHRSLRDRRQIRQRDDPALERGGGELGALLLRRHVVEPERVEQRVQVRLDGLRAEEQLLGDLAVGRQRREAGAGERPAQRDQDAALRDRDVDLRRGRRASSRRWRGRAARGTRARCRRRAGRRRRAAAGGRGRAGR